MHRLHLAGDGGLRAVGHRPGEHSPQEIVYWQQFVVGVVLISAVVIDTRGRMGATGRAEAA